MDDDRYTVVGVLPADFQFGSTAAGFQARSVLFTLLCKWLDIAVTGPHIVQRSLGAGVGPGSTRPTVADHL
jgi:hypothetical protein